MTGDHHELHGLHDPAALPRLDGPNGPYFAAAARGELLFQRCGQGHAFLYPRLTCPVCHSAELSWERSEGGGEVMTFAAVHRPPWDAMPRARPYLVVLVRLDEGPQLLSTLEGVPIEEARIGQRVRAAFERVSEELGLVRFVAA